MPNNLANTSPPYFGSCYDWRGNLRWLFDYFTGPDARHSGETTFGPQQLSSQEITPRLRVAFLGDLMSLKQRRLEVTPELKEFLSDADWLVANLEGLPSDSPPRMFMGQHHPLHFFGDWASGLFPPERTALSLANNHAEDFGQRALTSAARWLSSEGFQLFGTQDSPTLELHPQVGLTGATAWSGHTGAGVHQLQRADGSLVRPPNPDRLNLLFVHWGREFQLYPSPEQIRQAHSLLEEWDGVFGHHSHCPQPIQVVERHSRRRPVAFSLGNFCFRLRNPLVGYGIAAKLELGPDSQGRWSTGALSWRFTRLEHTDRAVRVGLSSECELISC